jgi:hypothetical protein
MGQVSRIRVCSIALVIALATALIACGGGAPPVQRTVAPTPAPTPAPPPPAPTSSPSAPSTSLAISTSDLPIGTMQQPYAASLAATGNSGAVKWSVISGVLPAGVTLASDTGALTGTPTSAGIFNVGIQAADSIATVSRALKLHVSGNGTYYHQYTKPGTYNVRVTTVDSLGNTVTATQTIVIGSK